MNREIQTADKIDASINLPGSKYIANRLVPLCALAKSPSQLTNVVINNDINTAIEGMSALGYSFARDGDCLNISPRQNASTQAVSLYTAHSGTFSRFIAAIAAFESVPVTIECSAKMATRPMQELFTALESLGVSVTTPNGCLPATVKGPFTGVKCELDASRSSQYLSALLIIAPLLSQGLEIEITDKLVSRAYIDMTVKLMKTMGVAVIEEGKKFTVSAGQEYQGIDFRIPGDTVSASYFMGAAAISGGCVTIENYDFESLQGEAKFYQVLERMGVTVTMDKGDLTLQGPQQLTAIEVDMGEMPDAVQTLAVVASFAQGETRINNIAHLAFKESDRIADTAAELRKTGIQVDSGRDYLSIQGGQPHGAIIETHDDHRMAMSMALLGIKTSGIQINNAEVVEKSFPLYWQFMENIGLKSRPLAE